MGCGTSELLFPVQSCGLCNDFGGDVMIDEERINTLREYIMFQNHIDNGGCFNNMRADNKKESFENIW